MLMHNNNVICVVIGAFM